jgi:AcrR family transcriptional regulator
MAPPSRGSRPSRTDRRAAIGERLLVAAERMLADGEPYAEISVERLSRKAELTRTTFYVYFEDKADLLHSWLERIEADIGIGVTGWWELSENVEWDDLRAVLHRILSTYRPHLHLMSAVYDAALFDRALDLGLQAIVRRTSDGLRRHIEHGQQQGWVDPALLPAETAAWLAWMIQRGQRRLTTADDQQFEREVDAYTDIFWNVLYAPTRHRPRPEEASAPA